MVVLLAAVCFFGGSIPETPKPATPAPPIVATPSPAATRSPIAIPTPDAASSPSAAPSPGASASPSEIAAPTPPPTPAPPPLVTLATPSVAPVPGSPDGVLTAKQLRLHQEAAARLVVIVEEAFAEMRRGLLANERVTEASVTAFIAERLKRDGLVTERRPIVAAASNASYPDHLGGTDIAIERAQIVLIDVMAKRDDADGVYARTTWVAFTGKKAEIPARVERVWKMVRDAREAALERVKQNATGADADAAARAVIRKHKHAPWFQHAAGEPLGGAIVARGVALKAGETAALPQSACWALRPAVYYPAEFGIRSEVDFCLAAGGSVEITTGVRQREIRPLLE